MKTGVHWIVTQYGKCVAFIHTSIDQLFGQIVAETSTYESVSKNNSTSVTLGNGSTWTVFHQFALANVTLISDQLGLHGRTDIVGVSLVINNYGI